MLITLTPKPLSFWTLLYKRCKFYLKMIVSYIILFQKISADTMSNAGMFLLRVHTA